jgi:two-component system, chemotaxis family, protein-glutamate methylesterase/glutaminase
MSARIRVLIVDDSAFARKVLREMLSSSPDIEVVGIARDGLEALERAAELRPDVMTLDLIMPNLDGLGVLDTLDPADGPRVLVVSTSNSESELALAALERGAVDLVNKPTALATERLYEMRDELVTKVKIAAHARRRVFGKPPIPKVERAAAATTRSLVVIGTSTGGPQALSYLLSALPADFPAAIAVALHIPPGYTNAFASRINASSAIEVLEAYEGIALSAGRAVIAPGGSHLKVQRRQTELFGVISRFPADTAHFPSVDVLFESAAEECGAAVLGLVLTGMGEDGRRGAARIRGKGGLILTESASSCVVYGMPRSVKEAGDSDGEAPLQALAALLCARL